MLSSTLDYVANAIILGNDIITRPLRELVNTPGNLGIYLTLMGEITIILSLV